ncbi:UTRA domain-containing protein [Streptomyces luteogriseus]|uniref:UTRA domain-containing protein n=1 Tax=Streptomyces luteogriseus TaxID=68233 RepID=UPI003790A911
MSESSGGGRRCFPYDLRSRPRTQAADDTSCRVPHTGSSRRALPLAHRGGQARDGRPHHPPRRDETNPPADIRTTLGLQIEDTAVRRSQLLLIDDEPAELVASSYPLAIAQDTPLMDHHRIKGGTAALLRQLGHVPHHCVDRVSARVPTQEQSAALTPEVRLLSACSSKPR